MFAIHELTLIDTKTGYVLVQTGPDDFCYMGCVIEAGKKAKTGTVGWDRAPRCWVVT